MMKSLKKIIREEIDDLQWIHDIKVETDLTPAQIYLRYDGMFPSKLVLPYLKDLNDVVWNGDKLLLKLDSMYDFHQLFVDDDRGYHHINSYLAQQLFDDDSYWEPYFDIVQDWGVEVWERVMDNEKILKYIQEYVLENEFEEAFDGPLTKEMVMDGNELGELIEDHIDFEDLKMELTWAYEEAYNIAARDDIYEAAYGAIEEIFGKGEWSTVRNNRGRVEQVITFDISNLAVDVLYEDIVSCFDSCRKWFNPENHIDVDEGETELEAFERFCEECIEVPYVEHGSFLDFYREFLYNNSELLNPRYQGWPDDDKIDEYFEESVYGRI